MTSDLLAKLKDCRKNVSDSFTFWKGLSYVDKKKGVNPSMVECLYNALEYLDNYLIIRGNNTDIQLEQFQKEEIKREIKLWQDFVDLIDAERDAFLATVYGIFPTYLETLRELVKIQDVIDKVRADTTLDAERCFILHALIEYEEKYGQEVENLEATEESIGATEGRYEDLMKKLVELISELNYTDITCSLDKLAEASRFIIPLLKTVLGKFKRERGRGLLNFQHLD